MTTTKEAAALYAEAQPACSTHMCDEEKLEEQSLLHCSIHCSRTFIDVPWPASVVLHSEADIRTLHLARSQP